MDRVGLGGGLDGGMEGGLGGGLGDRGGGLRVRPLPGAAAEDERQADGQHDGDRPRDEDVAEGR
jgi:hypothetical protein